MLTFREGRKRSRVFLKEKKDNFQCREKRERDKGTYSRIRGTRERLVSRE